MKKFFAQLEDLWVTVAFAEAGEYDTVRTLHMQPRFRETISFNAL